MSVTFKYLIHGKTTPCSVRLLPNDGWPPPARCFLPLCVFPCRLLCRHSATNAGSSCTVLRRLHLAPHNPDSVRRISFSSRNLVSDRRIGLRSTTPDLLLMVCQPTFSTRGSVVSSTSTSTVIGRVDGATVSTLTRSCIIDSENQSRTHTKAAS